MQRQCNNQSSLSTSSKCYKCSIEAVATPCLFDTGATPSALLLGLLLITRQTNRIFLRPLAVGWRIFLRESSEPTTFPTKKYPHFALGDRAVAWYMLSPRTSIPFVDGKLVASEGYRVPYLVLITSACKMQGF